MEETTLDPSSHLGSPNHELSFELYFFGLDQLNFPPKWCHVDATSIWLQLVVDPHLKALGPIYGFQPIGMFHFVGPWTFI
jgi:hypothetical protein